MNATQIFSGFCLGFERYLLFGAIVHDLFCIHFTEGYASKSILYTEKCN